MEDETLKQVPGEPRRRLISEGVTFALGIIIAYGFIGWLDHVQTLRIKELTLGQVTNVEGIRSPVLCTDFNNSDDVFSAAVSSKDVKILWLGNSQLPTINQMQPRDQTMVDLLHDRLRSDNVYTVGFAPPNANLEEHYLLAAHLISKLNVTVLLLPVFFDDLRESGIRLQLGEAFNDAYTVAELNSNPLGRSMVTDNSTKSTMTTATAETDESTSKISESWLNDLLSRRWSVWSERGTYRSVLFVQLHYLRNTVFGIKPDSIRKMIPATMSRNLEALNQLLDLTQTNNVKVVLYIPPIRNDVPIPYNMDAYHAFKMKIEQLATERELCFADFENTVKPKDWGTKSSASVGGGQELDFMHFSAAGHVALSKAIEELLRSQIWFPPVKRTP